MSLPDETATDGVEDVKLRRRMSRRHVAEWTAILLVAVLGSFLLRVYVVQTFLVPSGSMLPTLQIGDRLIVDKIPGLAHSIHRGDIIVFHRAPGDTDPQYPILVKRVIGLPGETISSKGDTIYINGKPIAEPWLAAIGTVPGCAEANFDIPVTHIKSGRYFVMGDCRGNSSDSRFWGTVPTRNIIGRVFLVIWRHNHPWFHWF